MANDIAVMFADGHLQDRAWANRPIEGDSYCSFKQIIDYAVKNRLPVIGAGDLIDKQRNTSGPIVFLHKQLDRLALKNLPFFYTQGQHEMDEDPWLSGHRTAVHLHRRKEFLHGVTLYGIDYMPAEHLPTELGLIPEDVDLLICHQVWADWMGDIASPQGCFGDIPVVNNAFSGDYHIDTVEKTRGKDGQQIEVLSPGSIAMQSIDEDENKYFFVLMDDLTFRRVKLMTRRKVEWTVINRQDEVEQFVETIDPVLAEVESQAEKYPKGIRKPLLRVQYSSRLEGALRRIMKAVDGRAFVFPKETPPQKAEVEERRARKQRDGDKHATTLESLLPGYLESEGHKALQDDCQRLLQAGDVSGELQRMKKEALT